MKLSELNSAAGQNPALRRVLQQLESWASAIEAATGINPVATSQGQNNPTQAPPDPSDLAVTGQDGFFKVQITLPDTANGPIIHELSTSSTLPFSTSKTIVTFPDNPATYIELLAPNMTLYFQLRSRFYTSDFNNPVVSGAVSSGLLPSDALLYGELDSGGIGFRLFRRPN